MTTDATNEGPEETGPASRPRASRRRERVAGGRRHSHNVRVTPEEEARLQILAQAHRLSVPRLLVESALAGGADQAAVGRNVIEQLFGLERLLANVANNVNQIARTANATMEVPPETDGALDAVRRVAFRIEDVIDQIATGTTGRGDVRSGGRDQSQGR